MLPPNLNWPSGLTHQRAQARELPRRTLFGEAALEWQAKGPPSSSPVALLDQSFGQGRQRRCTAERPCHSLEDPQARPAAAAELPAGPATGCQPGYRMNEPASTYCPPQFSCTAVYCVLATAAAAAAAAAAAPAAAAAAATRSTRTARPVRTPHPTLPALPQHTQHGQQAHGPPKPGYDCRPRDNERAGRICFPARPLAANYTPRM